MKLDGKQKRIAAAIAAGGALALVVLLSKRGGSSAPEGAVSSVANPGAGDPSSFADNGAAMGQLSTDVTNLAGDIRTGLGNLTDANDRNNSALLDSITARFSELGSQFAAPAYDPPAPAEAPAQLASSGMPAARTMQAAPVVIHQGAQPTAAQTKAAAAPNVAFQDSGTRAGLLFQTVVKDSKVYRFYESKPGKKDYGQTTGSKVYVRPASH